MESDLSVRDILTNDYVAVSESDTVLDAVRLMREERVGYVLVVRGADPVGILTEWDVLGLVAAEESPKTTLLETAMSAPVLTVEASLPLSDAATKMTTDNIRHLVVTDEEDVLGVLTQRDVIAAAGSFRATTVSPGLVSNSAGPDEETERPLVSNGGEEYTTQGVCEACGALAASLREANGRLVCLDCRNI
ncbi:CBS domain-containing protein [Natronobiforma cellulositropha]|uniref:CBS domain-containing protein n=1 Tax=Natronobiforma cellulositropha TaxID=1679076 RepID=UPI0021D5E079|nr:CBS domain-containing protein [Natronobiforma cellulositropha]